MGTDDEITMHFRKYDTEKGNGNEISFENFCHFVEDFMTDERNFGREGSRLMSIPVYDMEEEEEEEVPEDLADLPEHVQQRRIIFRSIWMMGSGTGLVLL